MCNEGYASSLAVEVLHEIGVKGAVDLDGGFRRWKAEGLPVVERCEAPAAIEASLPTNENKI